MVFVLKYRKDLISDFVFNELKDILEGIALRYHLSFQAVGTDKNHLHLLVESAPRFSPSRVMQICKSVTAVQLFKRLPELKDIRRGGHFWSEGGHIDTVGDGYDVKQMEKYILNQGVSRKQVTLTSFSSTDVDYIYFSHNLFISI
jgi:putative transposase